MGSQTTNSDFGFILFHETLYKLCQLEITRLNFEEILKGKNYSAASTRGSKYKRLASRLPASCFLDAAKTLDL